ncbi:MAG: hypothetical protein RDV48_10835 [Candidatus Eremiobacteraeota bacterium]|nr:hypothetical protein [Candidatus Eremiobacteraeota bacterium]
MPRVFADQWGVLEFEDRERGIISRSGFIYGPGGKEKIPLSIMISPAGKRSYDRSLAGAAKAAVMNEAFGDWVCVHSGQFKEFVARGLSIKWVSILFGARAFHFPMHFSSHVDRTSVPGTIVLKNQRKPAKEMKRGWEISCWGYAPHFEMAESFKPLSDEEKRKYPFMSKEKVLKARGIDYFKADILVISEGAGASGETVESTLVDIFETLRSAGEKLPSWVFVYINFGSTLTAVRAWQVCTKYGVRLSFTFMGSAIHVSPDGLLPGLPYTDLSHLDARSVTYRELYLEGVATCTDLDGRPVYSRCSCGDVGDSLDSPSHYSLLLVLENLILRIPLHREGLMELYNDPVFLEKLIREVQLTEEKHHAIIRNTRGESVLEIIKAHAGRLSGGSDKSSPRTR